MKHISEVLEKILEDLKNKSEENEKDEKAEFKFRIEQSLKKV